jgi:hypothetical protein
LNAKNRAVATLDKWTSAGKSRLRAPPPESSRSGRRTFWRAQAAKDWRAILLEWKGSGDAGHSGLACRRKTYGKYRVEGNEEHAFLLGLQLSGVALRKLAEDAQLEPGKTEGTLQGSIDLAGDPQRRLGDRHGSL